MRAQATESDNLHAASRTPALIIDRAGSAGSPMLAHLTDQGQSQGHACLTSPKTVSHRLSRDHLAETDKDQNDLLSARWTPQTPAQARIGPARNRRSAREPVDCSLTSGR